MSESFFGGFSNTIIGRYNLSRWELELEVYPKLETALEPVIETKVELELELKPEPEQDPEIGA